MNRIYSWLIAVLLAAAAGAGQNSTIDFSIAAQPLSTALIELSKQANIQVLTSGQAVEGMVAGTVAGRLTVDAAVESILKGSGFTYRFLDEKTLILVKDAVATSASGLEQTGHSSATAGIEAELRLARTGQTADAADGQKTPADVSSKPQESSRQLSAQEIVVTAQKQSERLQDVPVPVTAITAEALIDSNQLRLQDYFAKVPGLNLTPGYYGPPVISIRGVSSGSFINPTVGIMVDDVPYGPSTAIGGGTLTPDIDPSDLSQVEVLRGPQGTLYGASSVGGLIKYSTVDPSTERASGRVQAGISSVRNGDEAGYSIRGAVNVPLGESFAVRASGYTRNDPGYLDSPGFLLDPSHRAKGINSASAEGGRLSALWRLSPDVSLKLAAMVQSLEHDARSNVNLEAGLTGLQQRSLRETGWYDNKVEVYSANLEARIGAAELTAIAGYNIHSTDSSFDWTRAFAFPGGTETQFGVPGTAQTLHGKTKKFTQEIRLSAPLGSRVRSLLGLFYTDEDSQNDTELLAVDPVTLALAGRWFDLTEPSSFWEYALFANLTFDITDRFDVQVGGRGSKNKQRYSQYVAGLYNTVFGRADPFVVNDDRSQDDSFTYLITPRFKLSPDLMVYARLASGYRPGGPNINGVSASGAPPTFNPDTTQNYEVGAKGSFLNDALSFDASAYYIDWRDMQLNLISSACFCGFFANAGGGKSEGLEVSIEARPIRGLTISAWAAWNDAVLTRAFPIESLSAFGRSGERLPYSSRFSSSLAVQEEFPLAGTWSGFIGASASYVGERAGDFRSSAEGARALYPGYTQIDLHGGLKYGDWTLNAFATNVTDKRGVLAGDALINTMIFYIQPRTVGVSLSRQW